MSDPDLIGEAPPPPRAPSASGPETVRHSGDFLTTTTHAADIRRGDLIVHPHAADGALHRVTHVERHPETIVIRSRDVHTGAKRSLTTTHRHAIQKVIVGVATMLALLGVFATAAHSYVALRDAVTPPAKIATTVAPAPRRVVIAAPRTAAGYQRLFAKLDPAEWGAGDGAVTIPLADGRVLWLFGDTLSSRIGGFVHSTAIVQTGGVLHVSHAGAQLIPDDDATHIYWIQSAKVVDRTHVAVAARSIRLTGTGMWDFADNGFTRTATCSVSKAGDITFESWGDPTYCPLPDPGPMYNLGDGDLTHFGYTRLTHPELHLSGGDVLVSTCQGWTDTWADHHNADGSFRWTDYQPIFSRAPAA